MLPVVWNDQAKLHLVGILDFIAARNPSAADMMQERFARSIEHLPDHPLAYREGLVPGTRELVVHPSYILVYRVEISEIRIVAVLHTSQQYPPA